jgi:hypothetical protein
VEVVDLGSSFQKAVVWAGARSRWAIAPLLYLLVAGKAFAQDAEAVTSAFEFASQGVNAFEQGQTTEALDKFSRAYALVKVPSLAVYMAQAHARLGHYTAAAALYAEATHLEDGPGDHDMQQNAREEAQREGNALLARMPRLVVQTPGIPIQTVGIQVDGVAIPSAALAEGWRLDPGVHRIVATSGEQRLEQNEPVSDGVTKTVVFIFQPTKASHQLEIPAKQSDRPPTEPGTRAFRNATWVSFGIGGAALAFSGTTAIWAMLKSHDLNKAAPWDVNHCAPGDPGSDCREYKTLRTLSTLGFYTGLAGVATGAVLLLATPSGPTRPQRGAHLAPWVGVGSAGVSAQF